MTAGFNPMRWKCAADGCFNEKRRPKIEVFADCFPRRINFGDVDGLVEINGAFCLLEWKGDGGSVRQGQHRSYIEFTKGNANIVFVVNGDAETMAIRDVCFYWNGRRSLPKPASLDNVKALIRRWVMRTSSSSEVA